MQAKFSIVRLGDFPSGRDLGSCCGLWQHSSERGLSLARSGRCQLLRRPQPRFQRAAWHDSCRMLTIAAPMMQQMLGRRSARGRCCSCRGTGHSLAGYIASWTRTSKSPTASLNMVAPFSSATPAADWQPVGAESSES